MRKICIFLSVATLLAAVSCQSRESVPGTSSQDTRYFAPAAAFGSDTYSVDAQDGGLDVELLLSRPAAEELSIGFYVTSSLKEDEQFRLESKAIQVREGMKSGRLHVEILSDKIQEETSWIELSLQPGLRYTVSPESICAARIDISKTIVKPDDPPVGPGPDQPADVPVLQLVAQEGLVTNPFLAETLTFGLTCDKAPEADLSVSLSFGELVYGKDWTLPGSTDASVVLPAGATECSFDLQLIRKDQCGLDQSADLKLVAQEGKYAVDPAKAAATVRLLDPVVDLKPMWRTAAANDGTGYQWRQAIKTPEGEWEGNNLVEVALTSEGSNYISNVRNLWNHSSFSCPSTNPSHVFRLTDFVPNLRYPQETCIIDYGNADNLRSFFPCDSLFRLVPDQADQPGKGRLMMSSPRTFHAYLGNRVEWNNNWKNDAKKTGGDLSQSTYPTGKIFVTMEKLEGTYDLEAKELYITAWFSSEDERFMQDVDFTKWAIVQEDGRWKVEYKIWPR